MLAPVCISTVVSFFFQAEDGIRDLVRSRGLGDVYKRQIHYSCYFIAIWENREGIQLNDFILNKIPPKQLSPCLLYTSDAADERSSVDLGGRRIIKKKNHKKS